MESNTSKYAAYHNRADVSFLLLEAGSNPNLKNGYNETPLDCALAGKHFKLARSLERSIYYNDEPGDNVANAKSARRELPEELEEGWPIFSPNLTFDKKCDVSFPHMLTIR